MYKFALIDGLVAEASEMRAGRVAEYVQYQQFVRFARATQLIQVNQTLLFPLKFLVRQKAHAIGCRASAYF